MLVNAIESEDVNANSMKFFLNLEKTQSLHKAKSRLHKAQLKG